MAKEAQKLAVQPWKPIDVPDEMVSAIKALFAGVANDGQQQRGMRWICESLCGVYDMSFRPGGPDAERETTFAEGKRFVGNQIIKITKLPTPERRA